MNKLILALRIVLACGIIAGSAGMYLLLRNDGAINAESSAFVQDTIVAIGARWDADELWRRATAGFRARTKPDELRALFQRANGSLGSLVGCRTVNGRADVLNTDAGKEVTALYVVKGEFEKGDAEIQIDAVKSGSTWLVDGFQFGTTEAVRKFIGMRG